MNRDDFARELGNGRLSLCGSLPFFNHLRGILGSEHAYKWSLFSCDAGPLDDESLLCQAKQCGF